MNKILFSAMIGNALEWYDYALYAQFTSIIAMHFFPNHEAKEMMALSVFAAGFIVRPIGAIVFGNIGDRYGRKTALTLGILTMAFPTAAIGCLPSYDTIGIAAPIILIIIRLIQGFSLGGEFSGCIAYIVENAPKQHRGLSGSVAFISMCIGMLIGSLVAALCHNIMSPEVLNDWGWRIPFVLGMFIGLIGLYIRWHLKESVTYQRAKDSGNLSRAPLRDILKYYRVPLMVSIGIYLTVTVPFYTITVFSDTFTKMLGFDNIFANTATISILVTMITTLPISAHLSDIFGRRPIMIIGCISFLMMGYPLFWVMSHTQDQIVFLVSICAFSAITGFYMGPVPTILVENFPTRVRFTGIALSYNMSAALFGGTAPMALMHLIQYFDDKCVVPSYLGVFVAFTMYSLLYYKDNYRNSLHDEVRY